jgi:hypothetical protein
MYVSKSERTPERMRLKRFMISLARFDNQRLIFHAARQTLRKAEMARLAIHEWLNQHDFELEDWKTRRAFDLGISVSEVEQQLLVEAQGQQKNRNEQEDADSE